jgi:5'-nucleotidase
MLRPVVEARYGRVMSRIKILVTNDDGIDSVGLHELARAMTTIGDVLVVAPDSEYSGASAAFGALHLIRPDIHEATIEGVPRTFTVSGPPALCVLFTRLGVFDFTPDLVVAGINPGANVGRSVYHSGTIGAALTGRNGGIPGVAVSQDVTDSVEGQGWEAMLAGQLWSSAAEVARVIVASLAARLPGPDAVLNVNVPNLPIEEIAGWRYTEVGSAPQRSVGVARLEPRPGHTGAYRAEMNWGAPIEHPEHLDSGAVGKGYVSLSWLSHIVHQPRADHDVDAALSGLVPHRPSEG